MVFAASSGVFTWISHWNMDDASTIKCLSPEKGKGKMFILTTFLREISFTVEKSVDYKASLDTSFLLVKLKCFKQIQQVLKGAFAVPLPPTITKA